MALSACLLLQQGICFPPRLQTTTPMPLRKARDCCFCILGHAAGGFPLTSAANECRENVLGCAKRCPVGGGVGKGGYILLSSAGNGGQHQGRGGRWHAVDAAGVWSDGSDVAAEPMTSSFSTLPPYVPLHVHSDFSLLDGASQLPGLVQRAKELGMEAVALTDHGVLYGSLQLVKLCRAADIKPIIGNEMYVIHGDYRERHKWIKRYHVLVLAKNNVGYQNLVRLTTISHLEGMQGYGIFARPCINRELLEKYSEGLIVCSGCRAAEVPQALLNGDMQEAHRTVAWYKEVFGADYYLEIQDHGTPENRVINRGLERLAEDLDVKLVATNDSHFTYCRDAAAHDALLCIQTGKKLSDTKRMKYTGQEYLKSSEEMCQLFQDHLPVSTIRTAVGNTAEIAAKVEEYALLSEPRLPNFVVPPGHDESSFLEVAAWQGLCDKLNCKSRAQVPKIYATRLAKELSVIHSQGFSAYFLVVWDIVQFARCKKIPVGPGRGSAAGSLVAFALGIISIDPVRHGLLFERFLNEERKSLPDIDTDFCFERRDEVIEYVTKKYGDGRVAQIVTFNRLTSKAVLKDVGRVLGKSYAEADALAKLVPVVRGKPAKLAALVGENSPSMEFRQRCIENPEVREWVAMAMRLEGTHKTFGVHAAGVVISPASFPLSGAVPLQRALGNEGALVTQYAMDDVEALGLLKMDLLGLKNLTCIAKTYELVASAAGYGVDLPPMENLPCDDAKTFALLARGELDGVFQLETSSGMRKVVMDLAPSCLEDIFAILALYRPGPLDAGLTFEFIDRKHGRKEVQYDTPALEPILRETYGVLLYQEQIMRMAQELAGYSLGQADLLRRAMGKKKAAEMEAHRNRFVEGAVQRDVDRAVAEKLFEQMVKFAEYCFNKSHSAAYGYITYVTAYLKANFPVAYMAALLSCATGNPDKVQQYIAACQGMGIQLLPPCVNSSGTEFTIDCCRKSFAPKEKNTIANGERSSRVGAIRFGLVAVRHVGEAAVEAILEARSGGDFQSLSELCERVDTSRVSKRALEALAHCGALDCLDQRARRTGGPANRRQLISCLDDAWSRANRRAKERATGQGSLFDIVLGGGGERRQHGGDPSPQQVKGPVLTEGKAIGWEAEKSGEVENMMLPRAETSSAEDDAAVVPVEDFSNDEKLKFEKELLGFYVSEHPVGVLLDRLPKWFQPLRLSDWDEVSDGSLVTVVVVLSEVKEKMTKTGKRMAILQVEDCTGRMDAVVFPNVFERCGTLLAEDARVLIWGTLDRRGGGGGEGDANAAIMVKGVVEAEKAEVLCIYLTVEDASDLANQQQIRYLLTNEKRHHGGSGGWGGVGLEKAGGGGGWGRDTLPTTPVVAIIVEQPPSNAWMAEEAYQGNGVARRGVQQRRQERHHQEDKGERELAELGKMWVSEFNVHAEDSMVVRFGVNFNVRDALQAAERLGRAGFTAAVFPLFRDGECGRLPAARSDDRDETVYAGPGFPSESGVTGVRTGGDSRNATLLLLSAAMLERQLGKIVLIRGYRGIRRQDWCVAVTPLIEVL
ncbi:hypothetical protein CBR_g30249 [Chara braunii]|uniref:DNA polymerase III subunit alpha n=1 Tax=Chara braunii TaxID=69332 RepID=A0A388LCG7_CHABU|nr:hypothetical protein CBR_g30249 [Chara braunii]|eukprot:GBG79988.1 hypothetical protein CBR_g30249 [Chara braunii]